MSRWGTVSAHSGGERWTRWGRPKASEPQQEPAGVHSVLITGLAPNTGYSVSIQTTGTGNTVGVFPGGSNATSDAGGVLSLSF